MNDCYFDKKDWRVCKQEVGSLLRGTLPASESIHFALPTTISGMGELIFLTCIQMESFRECWKRQGNDQRVATKDV